MKRFKYYFMSLLALGCLTACGGDDNDGPTPPATTADVTVTPEAVVANANGGDFELNVVNNGKTGWTAYASDACKDWVTVSTPNWSSAGSKVLVNVKANKGTDSRSGLVVIKAGSAVKNISVTQDAPMQLGKTEIYSQSKGETFEIEVKASSDWTATADQSWVTCAKASDTVLKITTAQNDTDETRTATVTVKTAAEQQTIAVKQSSKIDREIVAPEGYRLVWHDEFNEGTQLSSEWRHEVQRSGWVNNELQNYVNGSADGKRVTEIKDGNLVITCFKGSDGKIYSGRVYAKDNVGWTYGYFEARMILPKGKGTWPAYWMMPVRMDGGWPHCGEIDIMEEVGVNPNACSSSIHTTSYNHTIGTQKTHETKIPGAQDDYHIFAVEWTPDALIFYQDGKEHFRFTNDKKGNRDTWPFDYAFYPIFNLAWGGDWGGWNGVDEKALPCKFTIDYIRIFQKN
ncbi:MAG: family 16 glycosylhydrolase [Bacteroides sp.]|nr:family 16 glycosylhydrolase [Bacteroides sp.]MCM1458094.1 family 16 glycosylhydrolase [Lachnoclostridium sp.]